MMDEWIDGSLWICYLMRWECVILILKDEAWEIEDVIYYLWNNFGRTLCLEFFASCQISLMVYLREIIYK